MNEEQGREKKKGLMPERWFRRHFQKKRKKSSAFAAGGGGGERGEKGENASSWRGLAHGTIQRKRKKGEAPPPPSYLPLR